MKKFVFFVLYGAALCAMGFFAGRRSAPSGSAQQAIRHNSATHIPADSTSLPAAPKASEATGVRAFVPGRPFPEGGARNWILTLTPGLSGDKRGKAIASLNHLQGFATMDEDSVREVLDALDELTAEADLRNPQRRNNPNGDGVLDALMQYALMRMAQTNPEAAVASLGKNFHLNDGMARLVVMGTIATHDAERAEELALSLGQDQRKDALECVFYALANEDPRAALNFADRHQEVIGDKREDLFEGWVRRDPQAAMQAAVHTMTQSGDPEIVRNTIEEWSKSDPAAAAHWAAAHEGTGSMVARATTLVKKAFEDPQGTLQEFAALQEAGAAPEHLAPLTSALAGSLAARDVQAARSWAESLPVGDLQDRALLQVAREWLKHDAPATSEWILSLPAGTLRNNAAYDLSTAISRRDPAGAFEWARSIGNDSIRQSALQRVLENWREMDPDAAESAVESLPADWRPRQ